MKFPSIAYPVIVATLLLVEACATRPASVSPPPGAKSSASTMLPDSVADSAPSTLQTTPPLRTETAGAKPVDTGTKATTTPAPGPSGDRKPDKSVSTAEGHPRIPPQPPLSPDQQQQVADTCHRVANKLASVSRNDCLSLGLRPAKYYSANKLPILIREFPPVSDREPLGRVLLIGGTHADELTSISSVFKWMHKLNRYHTGMFHWRITPLLNPDGLLVNKSTRTNANGIDLNRNLPTPEWQRLSGDYWVKTTGRDPRRYPGRIPGSEPETQWLVEEIDRFRPDIIVSVHAPHGIVDYDALDRRSAPRRIGILHRDFLGTFPGSLGNYAGVHKGIPVVTLEMPHAYVMPDSKQITHMWVDLVYWLQRHVPKIKLVKSGLNGKVPSNPGAGK